MGRLKIERVTRWEYRPGERVGIVCIFGWCLVVVGFRYFLDGREVTLHGEPATQATAKTQENT